MKFENIRVRHITQEEALSLRPEDEIFVLNIYRPANEESSARISRPIDKEGLLHFRDNPSVKKVLVPAHGGGRKWDPVSCEEFEDAISTTTVYGCGPSMTRFEEIFVRDDSGTGMPVVIVQATDVHISLSFPKETFPDISVGDFRERFHNALRREFGDGVKVHHLNVSISPSDGDDNVR